jgi:hypothetical protein
MGPRIPANTPIFVITQSPPGYMITPETFKIEKRAEQGGKAQKALFWAKMRHGVRLSKFSGLKDG